MKNVGLLEFINGRKCAVLGMGVSNLPLVEQLCEWGVEVTVYDKKDASELGEAAVRLSERGVKFAVADGDFSGIEGELIFRSPGIRPDKKGIVEALGRGAELTSEIELVLALAPTPTYAVTGSDGKTTTTTLTGKFLQAGSEGKVYVGGNIGTPLLCLCEEMKKEDKTVLELSSFQLMSCGVSPQRVAITNVSPNHLDWHTDMDEYVRAKKNIVGERTKRLVTNADCPATLDLARTLQVPELYLFSSKKTADEVFALCRECDVAVTLDKNNITVSDKNGSRAVLSVDDINVPGMHNVENFMTAIGLTLGDVSAESYRRVAKDFFGVEHRLEFVRELDGVKYYNSSIDSSPTRTAAALSAMTGKSLVIICGGYDKNLDYAPLGEAICRHGGIRAVILTGATAEKIGKAVEGYSAEHPTLIYEKDFFGAVNTAKNTARAGDCVVLTPASASFDAFKNFDERGKTFKRIVNEW